MSDDQTPTGESRKLHTEQDTEEAVGREVLELIFTRAREAKPSEAEKPVCAGCVASILWAALLDMRERRQEFDWSLCDIEAAYSNFGEAFAPYLAATRVEHAMLHGEMPSPHELLMAVNAGLVQGEIVTDPEEIEQIEAEMEQTGDNVVQLDERKGKGKLH